MARKASKLPYAVAAVVAAAVVALAWVQRDRFMPVTPGRPAPDFAARTLDGVPRSLADYRGRVILLNIWATWCPPCREEMPSMQRLYEIIDDEDFEIVAVSVDAAAGEVDEFGREGGDLRAFVEEFGLTFSILHDPSGRIQQAYQTTGVPESFVIGRDGIIYKKVAGATEWDAPENVALIERLLGK